MSYKVNYTSATSNAETKSKQVRASTQYLEINGLEQNTNYTITVMASTSQGYGPASEPIFVATNHDSKYISSPSMDSRSLVWQPGKRSYHEFCSRSASHLGRGSVLFFSPFPVCSSSPHWPKLSHKYDHIRLVINLVHRLFLLCLHVVRRNTLVAAGHGTTQNLGGKKIGKEGLRSVLIVTVTNFVGFKSSKSS